MSRDDPALARLERGDLEIVERMPWSSNATFLAVVTAGDVDEGDVVVIYKPERGERPLWDFPHGTLASREVAAYEVSEASGWGIVPPTILRDGPYGVGMVQLFVDHDPEEHFLELRDLHGDRFREFAAFDVVINNADRKSGHCVRGRDAHVWGIDHGVSFHVGHKLRTVIWDYAGEPLPERVIDGLCRVARGLDSDLAAHLHDLLDGDEIAATRRRVQALLDEGVFPLPRGDYPYPWPLV
ncbi:MAG TPA: SCO1664 family protein [Acidimicrobiia bacterium]|nr:SCO1664 family protein [Acidimicrobiia bacterium]